MLVVLKHLPFPLQKYQNRFLTQRDILYNSASTRLGSLEVGNPFVPVKQGVFLRRVRLLNGGMTPNRSVEHRGVYRFSIPWR